MGYVSFNPSDESIVLRLQVGGVEPDTLLPTANSENLQTRRKYDRQTKHRLSPGGPNPCVLIAGIWRYTDRNAAH